jgi:septum formation protein
MRLVLASISPRRPALLRAAGFEFDTLAVDVDERRIAGESPDAYVRRLASEKSARAQSLLGSRAPWDAEVVLGADTAVVVDDEILGKPANIEEAASMLRRLAGRRHQVLTGISLRAGAREVGGVETTTVLFSRMSEEEVRWYAASEEGFDKAGGYAIQGLGARFVSRIDGSYSNVVGLPIATVYGLLTGLLSDGGASI